MSRKNIESVYRDVVKHLKVTFKQDNVHGFIGTFEDHIWPAFDNRYDYFEIPILNLKGIDVVDFLRDCEEHPCFLNAAFGSRSGDTCLVLRFLWIDPADYRGEIPRYITGGTTKAGGGGGVWSFKFLFVVAILVVILGFLKEIKKFPF